MVAAAQQLRQEGDRQLAGEQASVTLCKVCQAPRHSKKTSFCSSHKKVYDVLYKDAQAQDLKAGNTEASARLQRLMSNQESL